MNLKEVIEYTKMRVEYFYEEKQKDYSEHVITAYSLLYTELLKVLYQLNKIENEKS